MKNSGVHGKTLLDRGLSTDGFGLKIEQDEATGKNSLSIPLPEPEMMNSMLEGLDRFLSAFAKKVSRGENLV